VHPRERKRKKRGSEDMLMSKRRKMKTINRAGVFGTFVLGPIARGSTKAGKKR